MSTIEVKVPDIGDFTDVPVTELLVSPGDEVAVEDPLVALESDKATMEVPSPQAGTVVELKVAVGDAVSEGSVVLTLETADEAAEDGDAQAPEGGDVREKEDAPASSGGGDDADAAATAGDSQAG
ncbi:biotin/lipoyl-containing protein, partial [Patulibacter sp. S7RM1-6]